MSLLRRVLAFKGDKVLWYVVIALLLSSLLVVYSSTGKMANLNYGGNTSYFLIKQIILIGGCFIVMLLLQSIPYKYFLSFASTVLALSMLFLLLAKIIGPTINGTERWLPIPFTGLTFQPSELAKLGVVMYLARLISFYQTEKDCDNQILLKVGLFILPVLGVIFLDNFSTASLLAVVCMMMLFVGRLRLKTILTILGIGVGALGLFLLLAFTVPQFGEVGRVATVKARIENFWGPKDKADKDRNYQSNEAKIAVAKGMLLGVGPGKSEQRNYLPHPYSDFVFATIIEEYGLVGAGIVMLLYLIILYRVGVIVRKCTRIFPALLVTGLGLTIVLQALINMGVCVGLFPVTGQPLPLLSLGGTSLLFTSAAFGMMLSVSYVFSEEGERDALERIKRKQEKRSRKGKTEEEGEPYCEPASVG